MTEEKRKSRSIPLMDYYDILQLEFLSYYFRYTLYEKKEFKIKYFEFCTKKKKTIEKLAFRNCFPSIFNNEEYFQKKLDIFLGESGMPDFKYRDAHQEKHLSYWDKVYYFQKGVKVDYVKSDLQWIVNKNLCKFNEDYDFAVLEREDKPTIKVHYSEIKRSWNDHAFDFSIF